MKQSFRKPHRLVRKKSIFRNRFFWLSILFLFIIAGTFYLICFFSFFQIKEIIITGNQKIPSESIISIAEKGIEQEILFLPSKSIFLIDKKKINENISKNFILISEVEIKRNFPSGINILIYERLPIAIWIQNEKSFLIDEQGVIFEESSMANLLKLSSHNFQGKLELGKAIIQKENLAKILEIKSKLEVLKIPIQEILIASQERIDIKTKQGWQIYFNPQSDIDWQLLKLSSILENEIPTEKRGDLEYIELRFGNLAPFKYAD